MTPSGTPKAKPSERKPDAAESKSVDAAEEHKDELEPTPALVEDAAKRAHEAEQRAADAELKAAELQAQVDELREAADVAAKETEAAEDTSVHAPPKGGKLALVAVRRIGIGPVTDRPRQGGVYEPGEKFEAHDVDAYERLQRIGAALTPGDYRKYKLES